MCSLHFCRDPHKRRSSINVVAGLVQEDQPFNGRTQTALGWSTGGGDAVKRKEVFETQSLRLADDLECRSTAQPQTGTNWRRVPGYTAHAHVFTSARRIKSGLHIHLKQPLIKRLSEILSLGP